MLLLNERLLLPYEIPLVSGIRRMISDPRFYFMSLTAYICHKKIDCHVSNTYKSLALIFEGLPDKYCTPKLSVIATQMMM